MKTKSSHTKKPRQSLGFFVLHFETKQLFVSGVSNKSAHASCVLFDDQTHRCGAKVMFCFAPHVILAPTFLKSA
jgi:hypothetical protein